MYIPDSGLSGVACPAATRCEAVGTKFTKDSRGVIVAAQGMVVPITSGSLGVPRLSSRTSGLAAVACPSASLCQAVGQLPAPRAEGAVLPIADGVPGEALAVPGSFALSGVACSAATTCETVGYANTSATSYRQGVAAPITNGAPGAARPVAGTYRLLGVACPNASTCLAVGETPSTQAAAGTGIVVKFTTPPRLRRSASAQAPSRRRR